MYTALNPELNVYVSIYIEINLRSSFLNRISLYKQPQNVTPRTRKSCLKQITSQKLLRDAKLGYAR